MTLIVYHTRNISGKRYMEKSRLSGAEARKQEYAQLETWADIYVTRQQKKTDLPKSNDALASLFVVNARPKRYFYPIGGCIRTYAKFYNPLHFCPAIQQNQKHNFGVESIMFIVILSHIKLWTMLDILLFIILWYRVNGFLMVYHPTSKGLSRIIFSICVESVTGKLS